MDEIKPAQIFLSLGSNMGDREHNLETALQSLSQKMGLVKVSSLYDTAPVGNTRQERFLNLVCEVESTLTPAAVLSFVKEIEKNMGRQPGPVNGPRPIDIDILFYRDLVINTADLAIPHPRLAERAFVLAPLMEIAPQFVHPVTREKVTKMFRELKIASGDAVKQGKIRGALCMK